MKDDANESAAERFYETEIAPKLESLSNGCAANGVSLFAVAEWNDGNEGMHAKGVVLARRDCRSALMGALNAVMQTAGDFDVLIRVVMAYAAEHGHDSDILDRLGVPRRPVRQNGGVPTIH